MKRDQITLDTIPSAGLLAVGYVRLAAVPQSGPRSGFDAQIATIRGFTEAVRVDLVRVFEDAGQSAHNTHRSGLLALLAPVGAGDATVIVVVDLNRLARNANDLHSLMDSLARRGISIVSAIDPRGA